MSRSMMWRLLVVTFVFVAAEMQIAQTPPASGSAPLRRVVAAFERGESQNQRIVGGHPTTIAENPWQVAILATRVPVNAKAQFCGGSIVAPNWVLTAAHCVDQGTKPEQIAILAGTDSLLDDRVHRIAADEIIVHTAWNPNSHDFDIALLHVTESLGDRSIKGLSANQPQLSPGQQISVSGWGSLAWRDQAGSTILQKVTVPFVARDSCNKKASYDGKITNNMFCAGRDTGGADSCQGDSGGPATTVVASLPRLIGIVSWGEGCGFPKKYGVYTRVISFNDWVREKSRGEIQW